MQFVVVLSCLQPLTEAYFVCLTLYIPQLYKTII